jgi:hypothetical protein
MHLESLMHHYTACTLQYLAVGVTFICADFVRGKEATPPSLPRV